MGRFFRQVDGNLKAASESIQEIRAMMTAMYQKFSDEHGLAAVNPPDHSLRKYRKEMARLERIFDERFNTVFKMLTLGQHQLTARFFETLASKVVQVFELANSETEAWLKALIAPMETQVREHKTPAETPAGKRQPHPRRNRDAGRTDFRTGNLNGNGE